MPGRNRKVMAPPSRFALTSVAALPRLGSGCSAVPGLASRPDRLSTYSTPALADAKARQHPAIVAAHGKRLKSSVIHLVFIICRIATPQMVLAAGWRLLCSRTAAHVKQGDFAARSHGESRPVGPGLLLILQE